MSDKRTADSWRFAQLNLANDELDRLRAEIERLHAERDKLRGALEDTTYPLGEIDGLMAEIERLRAEIIEANNEKYLITKASLERLQEIKRLEAALREINKLDDSHDLPDARNIARAAAGEAMSDKMITFEGNGPEIERVRYDNMVLRAEIERLTGLVKVAEAALRKIAADIEPRMYSTEMREIARAALEGK